MDENWQSILGEISRLAKDIFKSSDDSKTVRAKAKELQRLIDNASRQSDEGPSAEHLGLLAILESTDVPMSRLLALTRTSHEARRDWYFAPVLVCRLAERLLDRGEPMLAFDVISVAKNEGHFLDDPRVNQLEALALTRCGSIEDAIELLERLVMDGHHDEETLVLLAGAYRDLGIEAEGRDRRSYFQKSYAYYVRAYSLRRESWVGDRAVVMGFLTGRGEELSVLIEETKVKSKEKLAILDPVSPDRFWPNIALGDIALIRGRAAHAKEYYSRAAEHAAGRFGRLSSAMKHARLLTASLSEDWSSLREAFGLPNVVVFVGHMVDRKSNPRSVRFPEALSETIGKEIEKRLRSMDGRIGFASVANGGDTLFHEAIKELGGESHVVLPCNKRDFVARSVAAGGLQWERRAHAILERAQVIEANEYLTDRGVAYEYANRILQGLAAMRARQLDTGLKFLAVWDGQPGHGPGGTADHVKRWQAMGREVEIINPRDFFAARVQEIASAAAMAASASNGDDDVDLTDVEPENVVSPARFPTIIAALYFADVANFSKLKEEQAPRFVDEFIQLAADLLKEIEERGGVLKKNTWGDGIYIAFRDPRDAGAYALNLRDEVARISWAERGLPHDLDLRASLHAGPVFRGVDPMTGDANCMGSHVSKTARIEPITPKGEVYASQEFAALATTAGIEEFECHYIGLREYAKNFGVFPTYHVRRRRARASNSNVGKVKTNA